MKKKLRELTNRNNAWSNEYSILKLQQFIRGWVNYFKLADMKSLLQETDEWLRVPNGTHGGVRGRGIIQIPLLLDQVN